MRHPLLNQGGRARQAGVHEVDEGQEGGACGRPIEAADLALDVAGPALAEDIGHREPGGFAEPPAHGLVDEALDEETERGHQIESSRS
jgi:hypothetical protein